jgi:hypothetical protein
MQSTANLFDTISQNDTSEPDYSSLLTTFSTVDQGASAMFEQWDGDLQLFPSVESLAMTAATNIPSDPNPENISGNAESNAVASLSSQLMEINQRAISTMRSLAFHINTPLKVSSPQVDGAFKDTGNFIRIVNDIAALSEKRQCESMVGDGLALLALASHQHLLALFKAVCDSINQCLDLGASANSATEQQQLFLYEDGTLCVAQFVMILQLLLHLISRMDRSLFPEEGGSRSGGQTTPLTPESHSMSLFVGLDEPKEPLGLPFRAEIIAKMIPERHVSLRRVIQETQERIDQSNLS